MKRKYSFLISFILIIGAFFAIPLHTDSYYESKEVIAADYYSEIGDSLTGTTLRKELYDLMMDTHKTYTTYSDLSEAYKTADADPDKPGNVLLCYTGTSREFNGSFSGSINREHVWPNSKGVGKEGPGADAHHLRPCDSQLNSTRGNNDFDEVNTSNYAKENGVVTQNKYSSGAFEPQDSAKGEIARIIFYVGMHYGPDSSYNLTIVDKTGLSSGTQIGKLSTLLKWNNLYPVTAAEIRRNEAVQKIQGNRNPFIDHPEYACKIWGQENENTKVACADNGSSDDTPATDPKDVVEKDASKLLTTYNAVFSSPITTLNNLSLMGTNGSKISWSSSDANILSVDNTNGKVTIKQKDKNQTITLTATITYQGETKNVTFDVTIKHNVKFNGAVSNVYKPLGDDSPAQEVNYSYTFGSAASAGKVKLGDLTWNHTKQSSSSYSGWSDTKGFQMGSANNPGGSTFVTSDLADKTIKSISVEASVASNGKTTASIYIGNNLLNSFSPTTTSTKYTYQNTNDYKGDIKIEFKVTQKAAYIKNISIVYLDGKVKEIENTYSSISLQNTSLRFGMTFTKQHIASTLGIDANDVNYSSIELGVIAVKENLLLTYGYENLFILMASNYNSLAIKSPLFAYYENNDSYSVSLLVHNVDIYESYRAICFFTYNNTTYYCNDVVTSYLEIAEKNFEKYTLLKNQAISNGNYNNEYEDILASLESIVL